MTGDRARRRRTGRLSRRSVLGLWAGMGGAAAFAAACGGSKDKGEQQAGGEASTGGTVAGQSGAVAKIQPGHYEKQLAASQEELNAKETARRGGSIRFRYLDPPHFDAAAAYSCTLYDTHALVYNKVIRERGNAQADTLKLELEPDLAEKWEQPAPDATEFVFTFRKNVKWQNRPPVGGRAFNAEDVKLVWERYGAGGVQKDSFSLVDRMELPDPYTLRVKLKEPYVDFAATIAAYAWVTPRELWLNSDKIRTEAIGTGAFIRESWTPKQGSVFVRNPDYWELGADGRSLPYLDRVEAVANDNQPTRKALFRSGDLDQYVTANKADGDDLVKTNPNTVWFDVPQTRGGNVNGFTFNLQNPKFKDKRVRNAISMGIDRVNFDALLYDGLSKGFANTSLPWPYVYDQQPAPQDQGPTFQHNPAEAKKLLTAAGAENLEFEVVEFYMTSGSNNTFEPAQDMLRNIGVKLVNRHVDNPTAIQTISQRNYKEGINMVWGPPPYSVDAWIYPWYITNGATNYIFLSDPELDNLLRAQRKETDAAKRRGILRQIDRYLNDQNFDIWFPQDWQREMWPAFLKNYRTHGFVGSMTCYGAGQLRAVWVDKS